MWLAALKKADVVYIQLEQGPSVEAAAEGFAVC